MDIQWYTWITYTQVTPLYPARRHAPLWHAPVILAELQPTPPIWSVSVFPGVRWITHSGPTVLPKCCYVVSVDVLNHLRAASTISSDSLGWCPVWKLTLTHAQSFAQVFALFYIVLQIAFTGKIKHTSCPTKKIPITNSYNSSNCFSMALKFPTSHGAICEKSLPQ